jgi:serine/threonine protein kinase
MDSYCIHLKSWSNLIKFLKSGVVHLDLKPANISITVEGLTIADAT